MDGRVGDWMQTFTGGRWYMLDPRPEDVRIEDVAHGLANICRYNGQTERFYSVAEHCAHIAFAMTRDGQPAVRALQGLLHDAAEAYTGDIVRPLKLAMMDTFGPIERAAAEAIQQALGLMWPEHAPADEILLYEGTKWYDERILYDECRALFTNPNAHWRERFAPGIGAEIRALSPEQAERLWLNLYGDLHAAVRRSGWAAADLRA